MEGLGSGWEPPTPSRGRKGHCAPCPPSPSHHAVLGGSALLHGVFKQHVTFGVTETHPARPSQPASTQGVSKGHVPALPLPRHHPHSGTEVCRRAHGGHRGLEAGRRRMLFSWGAKC